ncbi:FMN-binding protein [bacterium]|nr:FMN-binding protein [bacterium]
MIAKIIIMSLLSASSFEPGIDYSPRLLHREVASIFGENDYRVTELSSAVSSGDEIRVNGKFFKISNTGGEHLVAYIGRVNSCRAGGCSNPSTDVMDTGSEYFDYFILFNPDKRVRLVRVFNYAATHGQEVAVKKWLDQFAGYDAGKPLRVGKEIDAISGATISVYAIVADVQEKMRLLTRHYL